MIDGLEDCDDCNGIDGDDCTNACVDAECGDGIVHVGEEECDDGNDEDEDTCDTDCLLTCGNGFLDGDEECDDGNQVNTDDCTNACLDAVCGDGIVEEGFEECDDGNTIDTDACSNDCESACGNGTVDPGEECDDGNDNDEDSCDSECLLTCGNDFLDGDEECDDGNRIDTDECTNACLDAFCGDGIVFAEEEECDDGNEDDSDGCDSFCEVTCGNDFIDPGEDCDDGNTLDGDDCPSDCRLPCPYSLCSCLGAAGRFAVVAGKTMAMKQGKYSEDGFAEIVESIVSGSACATAGKFVARGAATDIDGDLVLSKAAGSVAAVFGGYLEDGVFEPGTYVGNDLVTGGGSITNPQAVDVFNETILSPSDPRVAACAGAASDIVGASTLLKNLTPTQTLTEIIVKDGGTYTLNVGAGLQVINLNRIHVLSGKDGRDAVPSLLNISCALDTGVVVLNVASELKVGKESAVSTGNCLAENVVINLHGERPKVSLRFGAQVAPILLVPAKDVKLPILSYTSNVYTAGKVSLSGAEVEDMLLCTE